MPSDNPGKEYFRKHKDRFVQLPVPVMLGKGISCALMITILSDPQRTGTSGKMTHSVKKFQVPEYIVKLLEELPLEVLAFKEMSVSWLGGT